MAGMITINEHRERILGSIGPLAPRDMPLGEARGRVLANDIATRWPIPLFDNSAMDGYAVRRADATAGAVLAVVADVAAGSAEDPPLAPGEAARIMTGAPLPTAADAIVPLEQTDLGTAITPVPPERITVLTAPAPGAHIRRVGEDAHAGDTIVAAGTVLGAWQLSAIASAGHDRVTAHPAPRVAVISTGSELVSPGEKPKRGQIPESNSVLLAASIAASGADVTRLATVADDADALRRALDEVDADVLILSGGASVGAFDVVKAVLGDDFGVRFDRVAMQPGKPQGFGMVADRPVFCLPGNPVSVAVSFEMFVRPALRRMAGFAELDRPRRTLTAGEPWRCPPSRVQVLPVVIDDDRVHPATSGGSGSHLVSSLAAASAFAVVPAEVDQVAAGDAVSVMELS